MIKKQHFSMVIWIAALLISCNAFLDVEPKDRYLQASVFASADETELARKGIYTKLASDALYGGALTMGALDVMAQYYKNEPDHVMFGFIQYDYKDPYVATTFERTWETAYNTLLNINSFIAGVKNEQSVLDAHVRQRYLGEAYGLRAYIHFDLLRLFGPVYSENPDGDAIPYVLTPSVHVPSLLSAKEVGQRVLADLDSAFACLSAVGGMQEIKPSRFNKTAALALHARVSLYLGNQTEAAYYAQRALEERKDKIIFALPIPDMQQQYERYFSPTQESSILLWPATSALLATYSWNSDDLRFQSNWAFYPAGRERIAVFSKYAPPSKEVSLLRTTELYFILAECATDTQMAESYLQQVGQLYGELELPGNSISDKLLLAYRREFWGEGQLFYFYKRNSVDVIPYASIFDGTRQIFPEDYQVPVPESELIYR